MTIHYDPSQSITSINPPKAVAKAGSITVEQHLARSRFHPAARHDPRKDRSWFQNLYESHGKRCMDLVLVFLSLPVVLIVVGFLALLAATDGGNPFYCQNRVGRGGRIYRMWKLRTMVVNAETKLEDFLDGNSAARLEWNRDQKLKDDPRITRVGRLLRKASMDELPQLWNVLTGDMSLVGPRPMMPDQQTLYAGTAYFRLRPGITGPWQVSKRNDCTFADRARFDTSYERQLSLMIDMRLLVATVRVVLRGTGY